MVTTQENKKYIDFFSNIIKTTDVVLDKFYDSEVDDTYERYNLYLLSFFGLMRNGHPYEILEKKDIIKSDISGEETKEEKKQKKSKRQMEKENLELNPDNPLAYLDSQTKIIRLFIDGAAYECDEADLKAMFKSLYDAVVNPDTGDKTSSISDDKIIIPKIDFSEETKKSESNKKDTKNEEDEKKLPTIDIIQNDPQYPDDPIDEKPYYTFFFNRHEITIDREDGQSQTFNAVVYPLEMDMSDVIAASIFVAIESGDNRLRAAVSSTDEKKSRSIMAEFNDLTFIVNGSWVNGEFNSQIHLMNEDDSISMSQKTTMIRPSQRTSSFYLRHKGLNGDYLDAFPLVLQRNNVETGIANAVVLKEDGHERRVFSISDNSYISLWFDGTQKNVLLYWTGDNLKMEVESVEVDKRKRKRQ